MSDDPMLYALRGLRTEMQKGRAPGEKAASPMDFIHHLSPETLMALGVAKVHAFHRYGPHIPVLRDVMARHYQAMAHAGLRAGHAGEKGLSQLARVPMGLLDPTSANIYERAHAVGAHAFEQKALSHAHDARMTANVLDHASGNTLSHGAAPSPKVHLGTAPVLGPHPVSLSPLAKLHPGLQPYAGSLQHLDATLEAARSPNLMNRVYRAATGPIQDVRANLRAPTNEVITPSPLTQTMTHMANTAKEKLMTVGTRLRSYLTPGGTRLQSPGK
jgi:hypothetical protein